ncbi:isoaspartyl peptidase/L-asparaginase isoform X1 [Nematostella vectensis]|uniref:isoaspartyl peptidase/L-asparaginase isoform X1 n=2 Tax=Nematostella vectensis TaxID=45351 RepID=UPI0020771D5E|nr:isoaspartyl peptidase/L-asparaginase isoform X1 [Nematostella vectensis]
MSRISCRLFFWSRNTGLDKVPKRILSKFSSSIYTSLSKMGKGKHDHCLNSSDVVSPDIIDRSNFSTNESHEPCIIVHGGAWSLPLSLHELSTKGVQLAARAGYQTLLKGASAVDAVEAAVKSLEDNPVFNAGYGSALTVTGTVEMDAMIMDGCTLDTGAVACIKGVVNPVSLARHVMTDTPHCMLVSEGAIKFAQDLGLPMVEPQSMANEFSRFKASLLDKPNTSFEDFLRMTMNTESQTEKCSLSSVQEQLSKSLTEHDTVGAVAMDCHGNIACATSTGGLFKKMCGRVGDSPMPGSGGYACKEGGASTTGHGESIMKVVLAREVVYHLENGKSVNDACANGINKMFTLTGGQGGVISIDKHGNYGKAFSTLGMPWAAIKAGDVHYGLSPGEDVQVTWDSIQALE